MARDEIRAVVRAELQSQLEEISRNIKALEDAADTLTKTVARLSIVTVGDEDLGVAGLVSDVSDLKKERQATLVEHAKRAGIWTGITLLGGGAITGLWTLIQWLSERS
jgi:hypothetical protein